MEPVASSFWGFRSSTRQEMDDARVPKDLGVQELRDLGSRGFGVWGWAVRVGFRV